MLYTIEISIWLINLWPHNPADDATFYWKISQELYNTYLLLMTQLEAVLLERIDELLDKKQGCMVAVINRCNVSFLNFLY